MSLIDFIISNPQFFGVFSVVVAMIIGWIWFVHYLVGRVQKDLDGVKEDLKEKDKTLTEKLGTLSARLFDSLDELSKKISRIEGYLDGRKERNEE